MKKIENHEKQMCLIFWYNMNITFRQLKFEFYLQGKFKNIKNLVLERFDALMLSPCKGEKKACRDQ